MEQHIAFTVHKQGQAHHVESIVLQRVHLSLFYKQHLAVANEATWLAVAADHVHFMGGVDLANRPCPFISCLVRLLELSPAPEIVSLLWSQTHFKYVSMIALMFLRMTAPAVSVYRALRYALADYRKLRVYLSTPDTSTGTPINYGLLYVDVFSDQLENDVRVFGLILPRLGSKIQLVMDGHLSPDEELSESIDDCQTSYQSDSE